MINFDIPIPQEIKREQDPFYRDADFIRRYYPGNAERIINEALDGFEVIYEEYNGDIIGLATYDIALDNHDEPYMLMGVTVINPDYSGEGVGERLFQQQIAIAEERDALYITATADTEYGREYLERIGFELVDDEVTMKEHYKYFLD